MAHRHRALNRAIGSIHTSCSLWRITKRSASCRVSWLTCSIEARSIFVSLTLLKLLLTRRLSTSGSTQSQVRWGEELILCRMNWRKSLRWHWPCSRSCCTFFSSRGIPLDQLCRQRNWVKKIWSQKNGHVWNDSGLTAAFPEAFVSLQYYFKSPASQWEPLWIEAAHDRRRIQGLEDQTQVWHCPRSSEAVGVAGKLFTARSRGVTQTWLYAT